MRRINGYLEDIITGQPGTTQPIVTFGITMDNSQLIRLGATIFLSMAAALIITNKITK